jgi:hypothetical protein
VSHSDYEHYRAGVEELLNLARLQLTAAQCDRIRTAVRRRHAEDAFAVYLKGTDAEYLGGRVLADIRAADAALRPEEIAALETLVDAGLPKPD